MKTKTSILTALVFILQPWAVLRAGTSIDPVNRYAYGANIGWLNGVADTNNGAVMGDYVCSGFFYSANVGWINLGSGSPTNGIQYQNLSASDFGVNNDGLGNLSCRVRGGPQEAAVAIPGGGILGDAGIDLA